MTTSLPHTHRRRWLMPISLIVPLLIVIGLGVVLIQSNQGQLSSGFAPAFTLQTYDGGSFDLREQRGKVVLINFWASWCGPCRSEAAELNAVWDEFRSREFAMIGVGYLDNERDALGFIAEFGVEYPTGHDNGSLIARAFRTRGVPETYILDREGKIAHVIIAPTSARALRPLIEALLAEGAQP
ncbi:MAG: TlpA family protein disulfide reductase [Chloroflexi bacterium CFX4]|nr:TlpA family protein disulfide reductase [Chloroflexi bacterium CFX4]MDL1923534.1 TlpA family protein disulfide reductase [Chloroflexi bacterium CFX3]